MDLQARSYGSRGPLVLVLHGGPGAAGYMAPLARGLADTCRVIEPFQRGSGGEPLTVARHVADLHGLVRSLGDGQRPALVGSSWGAMLALAYAAAHATDAGPIVLIGCGTFDRVARRQLVEVLAQRTSARLQQRLDRLEQDIADPDRRLRELATLTLPLYCCDPVTSDLELAQCDARAHRETWDDMLRRQDDGTYPAAFAAIRSSIIMLHGDFDPHPGRMIRASLAPSLPRLEYHEWQRCGHYPWLERTVRDDFFVVLRRWLARNLD